MIPTVEQEAARDLVRAREDCRGDLVSARHRCSKLLLRQGILYSGGKAWTVAHDRWLRAQHFDERVLQLAHDSAYEIVVLTVERRDRLDAASADMAADSRSPWCGPAVLPTRGLHLTAFGLAVEIGTGG